MNDDQRKQFTISTIMILTLGAAVGSSMLRIAHVVNAIPTTFGYFVFGFYFIISGLTLTALPLILRDRIFRKIDWGIGTVCLFVQGCSAALFMPMVVIHWVNGNRQFQPWEFYAKLVFAHSPGSFALEGFYATWSLVAFLLFIGVLIGGRSKQWYLLRGYWAEGIGIWCLLAWSISVPFIVWRFVNTYI